MPTNVKRLSRFEKPGQYTKADREKINKGSFAGPHQSFPIVTQQDVYDAARLVGHAANPAAVRRRIIAIANRKGFKLPKSWRDKDEREEEASLSEEHYLLYNPNHDNLGRFSTGGGGSVSAARHHMVRHQLTKAKQEIDRLRKENESLKSKGSTGSSKASSKPTTPKEAKTEGKTGSAKTTKSDKYKYNPEAKLKPIRKVDYEIVPGAPPNVRLLRTMYGDRQLTASLNRYRTERLIEAHREHIGNISSKASRETVINALTTWAKGQPLMNHTKIPKSKPKPSEQETPKEGG